MDDTNPNMTQNYQNCNLLTKKLKVLTIGPFTLKDHMCDWPSGCHIHVNWFGICPLNWSTPLKVLSVTYTICKGLKLDA